MNTAELRERTLAAMRGTDAERAHALAVELCHAAPENYEYQQMAGVTGLSSGRADEAYAHFSNAIRLAAEPAYAGVAWGGAGQACLLREDAEEAESAFRRSLSLVPHFAPSLAGLAEALVRRGRHKQAEETARRARELGENGARLHVTLGQALLGQDRLDEAEEAFRAAHALDPEAPEPRFSLGTVAKVRGRLEEAQKIYREVLAAHPEYPGYGQLAELKTFTAEDEDIALMQRCLAELPDTAPPGARSDLRFALAKAWDDIGDIAQACEELRAGNRLERERIRYNPDENEARMQRIAELFSRDFIHRYEDAGFVGVSPVFVISLPRSGSTLMEQMLASHSRVQGGGEIAHFGRVATALSLRWGARADFPDIAANAARADLRESGREYARLTARLRLLAPHFTDKSLINLLYIGLIRMMLPEAKIVHMRRHPLATALGLYRQRFTRAIGYSFDLDYIVRHYRAYTRLMAHWRQAAPEAFVEVFYETLVANPERELRRVFDYIGLAFEPACLEFYKLDRPVRTASVSQVRRPLEQSGLERHERYRELLAPVAEGLAEEIAAYERALADAESRAAQAVE